MDSTTRPGFRARAASVPNAAPFSIQMSAPSSRRSSRSRPSALVGSMTMPRFPALWVANGRLTPSCSGACVRDAAPPGGSTRMTSAPRSDSRRPHISPLPSAMSITRTPSSGVRRCADTEVPLPEHELGGLPQPLGRTWFDEQRGDARLAPGLEVVADLVGGADERELLDEPRRYGGGRLVLLAVHVELLDLPGLGLVAHPHRDLP